MRGALLGLLVLGAAEIAVRVVHGSPLAERLPVMEMEAHPTRGWRMCAKDHFTYLHPVAMNSLGLRGPEIEPKAPGTTRVLCLGDSHTYGQGVKDDQAIPACVATSLSALAPDRTWEAVNAGHRAYTTQQEVALLEELGAEIDPDIVVVCWFWNDIETVDVERRAAGLERSGPVTFDTRTRIEGAAWWKWQAMQVLRRSALVMYAHDARRSPFMGTEPTPEMLDEAMDRFSAHCDRLLKQAVLLDCRIVIAVIPDPNVLDETDDFTKRIDARMQTIAEEKGLQVIGMQDTIRELARSMDRLPLIRYDGHYAPEANAAMGQAIAEGLLAQSSHGTER